jgi:chromosome segregation ATPase
MRIERVALIVLASLGSVAAQAQTPVYCCDDANGHRICGDPLPPQCYTKAYKELSRTGRTVREVDAPLTAEERQRKEAEDRAKRDAEARVAESRRRDKSLLESYTSVAEIDERRNTAMRGAEKEISTLKAREKTLVEEQAELNNQVAALKGKPAPQSMQESLAANASELSALRNVIAQKQRDADTLRSHFDEDRRRYLELTNQTGVNPKN